MEELERAQERLESIRGVKPILGGLRTISLGSWQGALKRRSGVRDYAGRLKALLPALVPHLRGRQTVVVRLRQALSQGALSPVDRGTLGPRPSTPTQVAALVIGSERGLCGRFNVAVAGEAERYLERQSAQGIDVQLLTLGSRAQRVLQRRGHEAKKAGVLSVAALPPFSLAFDLTHQWLEAYENGDLDAVDLIYNGYRGTGTYEPTVARLLPPKLLTEAPSSDAGDDAARSPGNTPANDISSQASAPRSHSGGLVQMAVRRRLRAPWPAPIIETDPHSLYATVVEQWAAVRLYEVLLDTAAAEHATRFQLMESATQNADRLTEELTLVIQTARRQEITQEMAELAAGAGLIGRE